MLIMDALKEVYGMWDLIKDVNLVGTICVYGAAVIDVIMFLKHGGYIY